MTKSKETKVVWSSKRADWQDTNGEWQSIRPVNILIRDQLLKLIRDIYIIIENNKDLHQTFNQLYTKNDRIRFLIHEILLLLNIALESVSLDFVYALLFPFNDEKFGILISLNFSDDELLLALSESSQIQRDDDEPLNILLNEVWKMAGTLPAAIDLVESLSAIDLVELTKMYQTKQQLQILYPRAELDKQQKQKLSQLIADENNKK